MDNFIPVIMATIHRERFGCPVVFNTSAANGRWSIQTTHTVTCKCCGFFQYMPAAIYACHIEVLLDKDVESLPLFIISLKLDLFLVLANRRAANSVLNGRNAVRHKI